MKDNEQTNITVKDVTELAEEPGFEVADHWPLPRVPGKMKEKAVQALVANHTLIVGQSRSGKTTAARRIIEEIIIWTDARVIILDPNADFRLLTEVDPQLDRKIVNNAQFADRWSSCAEKIAVATPGGTAWGIKWGKLSLPEMAAFLQLSPTEAFEEYRHLDRQVKYEEQMKNRLKSESQPASTDTIDEFKRSEYFDLAVGEELERYRLRLDKLSHLDVWCMPGTKDDLDSLFEKNYKAIVVDLSKNDPQVRMITAARTLEALWRQGEDRRREFLQSKGTRWDGTVVVIDEGHLFAPPTPEDPQKRLVTERIQRFADQGKKLNLYLMVITQQPGKLHPDVLSEFNNRIILRVNERRSLTVLQETYGGIRGRYDGALTFEPGEALVEGALLCDESPPPAVPRGIQFKKSRTREGGGTPKADWALPKRV